VNTSAAKPKSSQGIWSFLNRFLAVLIVFAGVLPLGISFLPEYDKSHELDLRIEDLKSAIEHQRLVLQRHLHEENLLKNDPEYVGLIARDRLDLMRDGETVYRVSATAPQSAPSR
jgi:cell division protein FtsB